MKLRRIYFLIPVLILCAALVLWLAKPLYRRVKEWRAADLGRGALSAVESKDFAKANEKLEAAARLAGYVPEVRLAAARLSAIRQDPRGLEHWSAYLNSGQATAEQFLAAGRDALRMGQAEQAAEFLKGLRVFHPEAEAIACQLAANLAVATGDLEGAWSFALRQVRLDPENPEARLLLAYAGIRSSDKSRREASLIAMSALAKGTDSTSLTALTVLANETGPDVVNQRALGARLKVHPLATAFHKALGAELQGGVDPRVTDRLLETFDFSETSLEQRHSAAAWFGSRGRYSASLVLLPEALALTRQDFLLTHLDALAGVGDWARVKALLENRKAPLDDTLRELYMCRTLEEAGRHEEASGAWTRAVSGVGARRPLLGYFLHYAESQRWNDRAIAVARMIMEDPRTAKEGIVDAVRLCRAGRDTRELREVLEYALKLLPASAEIKNDLAYCNLLLNEKVDESITIAHGLATERDRTLAHRITLALGLLRKERPKPALELFEKLRIPWDRAAPNHRAIFAGVLRANGREADAERVVKGIQLEQLLPEEALLAGISTDQPSHNPQLKPVTTR